MRGLAGAFRFFLRALGAKWGWMLGWLVGGGGTKLIFNCGLGMLYSVVDGGVLPWLLKYKLNVTPYCREFARVRFEFAANYYSISAPSAPLR